MKSLRRRMALSVSAAMIAVLTACSTPSAPRAPASADPAKKRIKPYIVGKKSSAFKIVDYRINWNHSSAQMAYFGAVIRGEDATKYDKHASYLEFGKSEASAERNSFFAQLMAYEGGYRSAVMVLRKVALNTNRSQEPIQRATIDELQRGVDFLNSHRMEEEEFNALVVKNADDRSAQASAGEVDPAAKVVTGYKLAEQWRMEVERLILDLRQRQAPESE